MAQDADNRYVPDNAYIEWRGVVLSTDFTKLAPEDSIDTVDTTAGSQRDRQHVPTIRDAEITLDMFQKTGAGGSATRRMLYVGSQGTLIWGAEGSQVGKPKYACLATITSISAPIPFDDSVVVAITFKRNGAYISHFEQNGDVW